jgi:hypothetical protein
VKKVADFVKVQFWQHNGLRTAFGGGFHHAHGRAHTKLARGMVAVVDRGRQPEPRKLSM